MSNSKPTKLNIVSFNIVTRRNVSGMLTCYSPASSSTYIDETNNNSVSYRTTLVDLSPEHHATIRAAQEKSERIRRFPVEGNFVAQNAFMLVTPHDVEFDINKRTLTCTSSGIKISNVYNCTINNYDVAEIPSLLSVSSTVRTCVPLYMARVRTDAKYSDTVILVPNCSFNRALHVDNNFAWTVPSPKATRTPPTAGFYRAVTDNIFNIVKPEVEVDEAPAKLRLSPKQKPVTIEGEVERTHSVGFPKLTEEVLKTYYITAQDVASIARHTYVGSKTSSVGIHIAKSYSPTNEAVTLSTTEPNFCLHLLNIYKASTPSNRMILWDKLKGAAWHFTDFVGILTLALILDSRSKGDLREVYHYPDLIISQEVNGEIEFTVHNPRLLTNNDMRILVDEAVDYIKKYPVDLINEVCKKSYTTHNSAGYTYVFQPNAWLESNAIDIPECYAPYNAPYYFQKGILAYSPDEAYSLFHNVNDACISEVDFEILPKVSPIVLPFALSLYTNQQKMRDFFKNLPETWMPWHLEAIILCKFLLTEDYRLRFEAYLESCGIKLSGIDSLLSLGTKHLFVLASIGYYSFETADQIVSSMQISKKRTVYTNTAANLYDVLFAATGYTNGPEFTYHSAVSYYIELTFSGEISDDFVAKLKSEYGSIDPLDETFPLDVETVLVDSIVPLMEFITGRCRNEASAQMYAALRATNPYEEILNISQLYYFYDTLRDLGDVEKLNVAGCKSELIRKNILTTDDVELLSDQALFAYATTRTHYKDYDSGADDEDIDTSDNEDTENQNPLDGLSESELHAVCADMSSTDLRSHLDTFFELDEEDWIDVGHMDLERLRHFVVGLYTGEEESKDDDEGDHFNFDNDLEKQQRVVKDNELTSESSATPIVNELRIVLASRYDRKRVAAADLQELLTLAVEALS